MSAPPIAAETKPRTSRIVFLDLARAAAVLFMIQGHTLHQLLDPVYNSSPAFMGWLFLRGLTSCMFLLLSGFAFSVASNRYWDELRRPSLRLLRRLTRFLFFLGLGYLIHFPMGRLSHLQFANDERWRSFLQVDILQVVAGSLLLLQGLALLLPSRRRFAIVSGAAAVFIVMATPLIWARSWVDAMPLWVASYLSAETGSNFPLFPWGAFMFFGAALGMAYARRGAARPAQWTAGAFAASGATLIAAGTATFLLPFNPFGDIDPWRAGPSMFVIRLGSVLLILGAIVFVSQGIKRLPRAVQALSQESLMIYVVHVAILYGSLWTPGLGRYLGRQDLVPTAAWVAAMMVSMGALAWLWNETKQHRPRLIHAARFAIACALIWPLL